MRGLTYDIFKRGMVTMEHRRHEKHHH